MTGSTIALIERFFDDHGGASLELPAGWFGRPFDNQHQLSAVRSENDVLIVTLDDTQVLRLRISGPPTVDGRTLVIPVDNGTWEWTSYGSDATHRSEPVHPGTVQFHSAQA